MGVVVPEGDLLATFSGSSDRTTDLFYVPGNQIRISWDLETEQYSYFAIYLYKEGEAYATDIWGSLEEDPQGDTYAYIDPGWYYFDFSVLYCDYTVTVETETP